jgi:hypothetical protein
MTVPIGNSCCAWNRISRTKKDFPVSFFPIRTIIGDFRESTSQRLFQHLHVKLFDLKVHLTLVRELFILCLTRLYNMVKRKPSVSSDLRTNSVGMAVQQYDMASLRSASSSHWGIANHSAILSTH